MSDFIFLNGKIAAAEKAKIAALDRGLLYGDGLFETIRAYSGKLFRFDAHIRRMKNSAAVFKIPFDIDETDLRDAATRLIEKNGLADANVRITLTRGESTGDLSFSANAKPTLLVTAKKLHAPGDDEYDFCAKAIIVEQSASPLAAHKTISYMSYLVARDKAASHGAREAIVCEPGGNVLEGATSNVFIVKNGRIFTPPADGKILPGIARQVVLEIADCEERPISATEMKSADEIFIANSIIEVMAVALGENKIAAGPVAAETLRAYRKKIKEESG